MSLYTWWENLIATQYGFQIPRPATPITSAIPVTSDKGRRALELEEGCRLEAYHDTKGVLTIGYGHTSNAPSKVIVTEGMTISQKDADALFRLDLINFERALHDDQKAIVTQQQWDAMISLEYNIGMGGMAKSSLIVDLNAGKPAATVADDFLLWDKPAILLPRRKREMAIFLNGRYRTT